MMSALRLGLGGTMIWAFVALLTPAWGQGGAAQPPAQGQPANPASGRASIPAVATDSRLVGDAERTRLIVDLTRKIDMRAFALGDPYRVIVDLEEVNFQLKGGPEGRGLISAYRYGLFATGKSRMVIDLSGPARIDQAFVLDPSDDQPARLVIDLVKTDAQGFERARAGQLASNLARKGDRDVVLKAPRIIERTSGPPVIVLDAGHGGVDSGAVTANGTREKDIVLAFVRALRDKLNKRGQYKVVLTRDGDEFISLGGRVNIAREHRGALFISIHADSIRGAEDAARGAAVYTLSDTASDSEAAKLAERENKADAIAGVDLSEEPSDVADILIELTQRETRTFSTFFARTATLELKGVTQLHSHPLRSAGFRVLRAHDVPSVLIELGYLSSSQDLKQLVSPEWRDRAADSLAKAVDVFFARRAVASQPTAPAAR